MAYAASAAGRRTPGRLLPAITPAQGRTSPASRGAIDGAARCASRHIQAQQVAGTANDPVWPPQAGCGLPVVLARRRHVVSEAEPVHTQLRQRRPRSVAVTRRRHARGIARANKSFGSSSSLDVASLQTARRSATLRSVDCSLAVCLADLVKSLRFTNTDGRTYVLFVA
jgi:hypothetical protein